MNQRRTITVDNLKCGGCSATISKRLSVLDGATDIQYRHRPLLHDEEWVVNQTGMGARSRRCVSLSRGPDRGCPR